MTKKTRVFFLRSHLCIAIFLTAHLSLAQDTASLISRLHSAEQATSLNVDEVAPFYLKIDVQLYDAKDKPSDKATAEEWWAGHGIEKRVYTTSSATLTEVRTPDELLRNPGAVYPPELLEVLLEQVVHPLPLNWVLRGAAPELRMVNFGKVPLECILVEHRDQVEDLPPSYCFDPGKESLRLTSQYGTRLIIRNGVGSFQDKLVPMDVVVHSGDVLAASGHISALMKRPVSEAELSTDGLTEKFAMVPEGVWKGAVHRVQPIYPEMAKRSHITGIVALRAVVGTDGHIHDLTIVSSPDQNLGFAAMDAVRKWIYTPYLVNGEPRQVETRINVTFTFGRQE